MPNLEMSLPDINDMFGVLLNQTFDNKHWRTKTK